MKRPQVPLARILPGSKMLVTTVWNDDEQPPIPSSSDPSAVIEFARVMHNVGLLSEDQRMAFAATISCSGEIDERAVEALANLMGQTDPNLDQV